MTPLSFDPVTAREVTGDAEARHIEAKARADADAGKIEPPVEVGQTYWAQVQSHMRTIVYKEQHAKRLARIVRKASGTR